MNTLSRCCEWDILSPAVRPAKKIATMRGEGSVVGAVGLDIKESGKVEEHGV